MNNIVQLCNCKIQYINTNRINIYYYHILRIITLRIKDSFS